MSNSTRKIVLLAVATFLICQNAASATEPSDRQPYVTQWYHEYPLQKSKRHKRAKVEQTHERAVRYVRKGIERATGIATQIVAHPVGCPSRAFCGCGVSVRIWGRPIRDLYLAANYRRFPPSAPGDNKVAWRYGHAFYIEKYLGNNRALAYDPNSGGHKTRIHVRSLAGYHIVDPHGSRVAGL